LKIKVIHNCIFKKHLKILLGKNISNSASVERSLRLINSKNMATKKAKKTAKKPVKKTAKKGKNNFCSQTNLKPASAGFKFEKS